MLALSLHSLEDTAALAQSLAHVLEPDDVLAFSGEIGAGKTTFISHLAGVLGAQEPVRSPTYTIAHTYELSGGGSLAHLDLYRSGELTEAAWGDIEPQLDAATYACIEWPRVASRWLSGQVTWNLRLQHVGAARAAFVVGCDNARRRALCDALLESHAGARQ